MHGYYHEIIGYISYAYSFTRPYRIFAVSALDRHRHDSCHRAMLLAKLVLYYISVTLSNDMKFPSVPPFSLIESKRLSTLGGVVTYNIASLQLGSWSASTQLQYFG